jgi:hypothetical protein
MGLKVWADGAEATASALSKLVPKAVDEVKDLMFLHNTSAEKLTRHENIGGMPMPSLAVTKKEIPFDGFGDITLLGKPEKFDPKASKLNQAFSADAYTVRAPQPVRVAKKGAGSQFKEKYGDKLRELGVYSDETVSNIWGLERKGDVNPSSYNQVENFFDRNAWELFLDEKGVIFDKGSAADIANKMDEFKASGEFTQWKNEKLDEIFEPQEYFISNPDRDYYTQRAKLKPYEADEITKFMKRSSGRNTEGGMASNSIGGVRASTTEELKSLQGMRDIKDRLVSPEDIATFKQTSDMMLDDLQEAFRSHYKYDQDGFGYSGEFREFVKLSEQKGMKAAAEEVGFDAPQELFDELDEYKDILRGGATEYFESKPKRTVALDEFGGAIVPEGTDEATLKRLKDAGVQVESYVDEVGRTAAREKFQNLMFQVGGAAVLGGAAMAPGEAEAAAGGSFNPDQYNAIQVGYSAPNESILQSTPADSDTAVFDALSAAAFADFDGRRVTKSPQWKKTRDDVMEMVGYAGDQALLALDKPMQGYLTITAVAGSLAAGSSMASALNHGANVAQQPSEQTTYNLGGAATDALAETPLAPIAPLVGAAIHAGTLMGSPI